MFAKTIVRWAALAVALPLGAAGVRKLTQEIEERRGSTSTTRAMRKVADMMHAPGRKRSRFARR
jgi:hypothetical protein